MSRGGSVGGHRWRRHSRGPEPDGHLSPITPVAHTDAARGPSTGPERCRRPVPRVLRHRDRAWPATARAYRTVSSVLGKAPKVRVGCR